MRKKMITAIAVCLGAAVLLGVWSMNLPVRRLGESFFISLGQSMLERRVSEMLGLSLPKVRSIEYSDSHGGFHGDGLLSVQMRFEGNEALQVEKALRQDGRWQEVPLTPKLSKILYGTDGASSWFDDVIDWELPSIGFWYFKDESPQGENAHGFMNFTAAVFDADQGTLSVIEFDS